MKAHTMARSMQLEVSSSSVSSNEFIKLNERL